MFFRSITNNPIILYIQAGDWLGLVIYLLALLLAVSVAISFHEWAHAFVAYKLGDPTAKNMGRMTIDPTKHITLIGLLCFIVFRIGFARPVMVNSRNLKHYRRDDFLISIAGVVTNLLLAFVFFGVYFFVGRYTEAPWYLLFALEMLIGINISFAVFNILPLPPLDGFHVLTSMLPRFGAKVSAFLYRYGFILILILLFAGILPAIMNWAYGGIITAFYAFYSLFI